MNHTFQTLFDALCKLRSQIYTHTIQAIEAIPALMADNDHSKRLVFDDTLQPDSGDDDYLIAGLMWRKPEHVGDWEIVPYRTDGDIEYLHNLNDNAQLCILERLEKGQYTVEKLPEPELEQDTTKFQKGSLAIAPTHENQLTKEGMYLRLWHGFKDTDARNEADDWGADGPIIGPLDFCHTTYASDVKFQFLADADADKYRLQPEDSLYIVNDCVLYDGMEYGDWSTFYHKPKASGVI